MSVHEIAIPKVLHSLTIKTKQLTKMLMKVESAGRKKVRNVGGGANHWKKFLTEEKDPRDRTH